MSQIKRGLTLCLILLGFSSAPLLAQAPAPEQRATSAFQTGFEEGVTAAQAVGTGVWTVGGFAGGLLLGPVGVGLGYALAAGSDSSLPPSLVSKMNKRESDYQVGFQQAFTDRLTGRRKTSALVGGLSGTVLFLAGGYVAYQQLR